MILYAGLYVLNFSLIIPLLLMGVDAREEGKPRAQQILIRYIQNMVPVAIGVWVIGQLVALLSLDGGVQNAQVFIGAMLAIVTILLASLVYAVAMEKREVARG